MLVVLERIKELIDQRMISINIIEGLKDMTNSYSMKFGNLHHLESGVRVASKSDIA